MQKEEKVYCKNCGAEVTEGNFCQYCGQPLTEPNTSISLLNKAVSTAKLDNQYSLVLVSCGTCTETMTGDLLEDIFGYTDAESTALINMAPVVVGERLTISEAQTVAQLLTEYGVQVSVTNQQDQYVDLSSKATSSVFDNNGNLLASVAAIIGALTVSNRIRAYRRFHKPSLLERLFHIRYKPAPPVYRRNFRPHINTKPVTPRRVIRESTPIVPFGQRKTQNRPSSSFSQHNSRKKPASPSHSHSRKGNDPHHR